MLRPNVEGVTEAVTLRDSQDMPVTKKRTLSLPGANVDTWSATTRNNRYYLPVGADYRYRYKPMPDGL